MSNPLPTTIQKTWIDTWATVLSVVGLLLFIVLLFIYWPQLPDSIPVHFNHKGEVDRWGGKATLLILPGVALFTYSMLTMVANWPAQMNYPVRITPENADRQYRLARNLLAVMKTVIVWGTLGLSWLIMETALSTNSNLGPWPAIIFVGAVFAVIGGYFVAAFRK